MGSSGASPVSYQRCRNAQHFAVRGVRGGRWVRDCNVRELHAALGVAVVVLEPLEEVGERLDQEACPRILVHVPEDGVGELTVARTYIAYYIAYEALSYYYCTRP